MKIFSILISYAATTIHTEISNAGSIDYSAYSLNAVKQY